MTTEAFRQSFQEPNGSQDQKPPPGLPEAASDLVKGKSENQAKSPLAIKSALEENRLRFLTLAIDNALHLVPSEGTTKRAQSRQNYILGRFKEGGTIEGIAEEIGESVSWVKDKFEQGLKRVWNFSPEELRKDFPREDLFMTNYQKIRDTLKTTSDLRHKLADESLGKEELLEIRNKFDPTVYKRNSDLFTTLVKVYRAAYGALPSQEDLSSAAEKLERDYGVVVFSFPEGKGEEAVTRYFVLRQDYDSALDSLNDSTNKGKVLQRSKPPLNPSTIYRSY